MVFVSVWGEGYRGGGGGGGLADHLNLALTPNFL